MSELSKRFPYVDSEKFYGFPVSVIDLQCFPKVEIRDFLNNGGLPDAFCEDSDIRECDRFARMGLCLRMRRYAQSKRGLPIYDNLQEIGMKVVPS